MRTNIICDLDGTIALDTSRAHHLHKTDCAKKLAPDNHKIECVCKTTDRDWISYFAACDTDEPNDAVIKLLRALESANHTIYILSGRSMSAHEETLEWLDMHEVPYNCLQLRALHDRTDDNLLKLRWAKELNLTPKNTLFVLEDRQRVVDMWRANSYRCFQVAPGAF